MTDEHHSDADLLRALMGSGGSGNTAQVTIRQDSLIAIAVGVICAAGVAVACTLCVAAVVVVAVMRTCATWRRFAGDSRMPSSSQPRMSDG